VRDAAFGSFLGLPELVRQFEDRGDGLSMPRRDWDRADRLKHGPWLFEDLRSGQLT
jgi:hypothetical protein